MPQRRAYLDIDAHLLRLMLDLPAGMQILGAAIYQPDARSVRVVVEGEDCPPPMPDGSLRLVTPIFRRVDTGQAHRESIAVYPPVDEPPNVGPLIITPRTPERP
jgi:hypothetical protein